MVDEVAERVRSLGGKAHGTLAEFSQHSRLTEQPGKQPAALAMVALVLFTAATTGLLSYQSILAVSLPRGLESIDNHVSVLASELRRSAAAAH